ncbi:defective in Cullin neddylation protein 1 [Schizophyllum fasciatum]
MVDRKMEEAMAQFCGVTGASIKDAQRFLAKYKRVDVAVDAYYSDPQAFAASARRTEPAASTSKLAELFEQYKDPDGDEIGPDGTIKLCSDLGVDPEDVVLLAVAYELKAPRLGSWTKSGWIEGWKRLGCDKLPAMQSMLMRLRDRLGSEPQYFNKVYAYTFEFSRPEGARSLAADMAKAFWQLLIPHGLQGGAVSHVRRRDDDDDVDMSDEEGWKDEYTTWWFEFLDEKNVKGISKDTWQMFLEFVRSIDAKFEKYDLEAAWPSTIDDFVEYVKERLARS